MTEHEALHNALAARFLRGEDETNRKIVFWHDIGGEYAEDVVDVGAELDSVRVIVVDNDEFAVKHKILVEEPNSSFLVYRSGEIPQGVENWLLDLELAHGVFVADRAALVGDELGVDPDSIRPLVAQFERFFNSVERVERLKKRLAPDDDGVKIKAKMCAVLLKCDSHSVIELVRTVLTAASEQKSEPLDALENFGLHTFFWEGLSSTYGYRVESPTIEDFILWIHRSAHNGFSESTEDRNLRIDFTQWRDSKKSRNAMELHAMQAELSLQIPETLKKATWSDLLDFDTFPEIDRRITTELADAVMSRKVSAEEVASVDRKRHHTFWYDHFMDIYTAIRSAAELLDQIESFDPSLLTSSYSKETFDTGFHDYSTKWFKVDQFYRQFLHAARSVEDFGLNDALIDQVENFYRNKFVEPLATAWQVQVDGLKDWGSTDRVRSQRSFFAHYVKPLLEAGKRPVIIISDALRFEAAEELARRIRREAGFEANLSPVLGALPSYTQLGMASLLPHQSIGFTGKGALVQVDGVNTDGTANRSKVLSNAGGFAIQAEELLGFTVHEMRAKIQEHKFVYVYHNLIDATGDKIATEGQVFSATARAIDELVALMKRLASADVGATVVTADHGFLYQHRELDESGYLSTEPHGDLIHDRDRRRVIGRGLKADSSFKHFTGEQLGLSSDFEVLIPKGTKRLKLKGSGSRFVHGGATLQEICVPVIQISHSRSNKKKVRPVGITINQKTDKITTATFAVDLFQSEPVTDTVKEREIIAGLYYDEELLSNEARLSFASTSEDPRERYVPLRLVLKPEADRFNNKDIELRLEEHVPNTSHRQLVSRTKYTLKRSFQTDF